MPKKITACLLAILISFIIWPFGEALAWNDPSITICCRSQDSNKNIVCAEETAKACGIKGGTVTGASDCSKCSTEETQAEKDKKAEPLAPPVMQITIPGLTLSSQVPAVEEQGANYYYIPWLAQYIGAVYKFGVGAAAILAVIVIIMGGFIWTTAGGNQERVTAAKGYIIGALVGLIIALGSYTIIKIVNPSLIYLAPLRIQYVKYQALENDTPDPGTQPGSSGDAGAYASVGGQCFPAIGGSPTWGFGDSRSSGARCHAGIDITGASKAVAVADGTVVALYDFYTCPSTGKVAMALLVDHGSYVANYGEIDKGATTVKVGDKVKAGQVLGTSLQNCKMLHFETYAAGTKANKQWMPPGGQTVGKDKNSCRTKGYPMPTGLIDPTETLKSLQSKQCSQPQQ